LKGVAKINKFIENKTIFTFSRLLGELEDDQNVENEVTKFVLVNAIYNQNNLLRKLSRYC